MVVVYMLDGQEVLRTNNIDAPNIGDAVTTVFPNKIDGVPVPKTVDVIVASVTPSANQTTVVLEPRV